MPIDITNLQVDTQNGASRIQNMTIRITGGTPNTVQTVNVTITNAATGQTYNVGSFNVPLDNQGNNNGFNTQGVQLSVPAGNYAFTANSGPSTDTYENNYYVCFVAGTLIRTSKGEVPVEELAIGDLVRTADGRDVPVLFIGRQTVHTRFAPTERATPIRIRAGALAENTPVRDLHVSQHHAIVVGDILCHAQALVNGTSIAHCAPPSEVFTYYSIELPQHEVILAEGAPVESFSDHVSRGLFDNGAAFAALYPEGREIGEMALPLAKSARQVPAAVHAMLRDRAALLDGTTQAA